MKRLTMATGIAMVACVTGLADVQHGLMGRYWRKTAVLTADQRASVTDWRAFKSLAESGTLVTEQLMDNSAGFILDDSITMNIPAELQGNADEANHWIGLWDGSMIVSASGSYGFRIECDDDGLLAVDGCNVTQTTNKFANSAYINLSAGVHRIFIGLYENTHGAGISVYVRMPNGTEQALPLSWLVPDTEADVSSGSGTLSPDPVLTVSADKGVSSWVGTLDGTGALSKVGDSEFDTKWANGSLVAAQGQLTTMTSGTADNVLIGDGATVAFVKGGTAKNLAGGGTLATGVHVYGFKISTDADCGITSAKKYTHKVNVCGDSYANGVSPVATVNGVTYRQLPDSQGQRAVYILHFHCFDGSGCQIRSTGGRLRSSAAPSHSFDSRQGQLDKHWRSYAGEGV